MIHNTPEGEVFKSGLNWTVVKTPFWFRLVWAWNDHYWYFRFRSYMKPKFIFLKGKRSA